MSAMCCRWTLCPTSSESKFCSFTLGSEPISTRAPELAIYDFTIPQLVRPRARARGPPAWKDKPICSHRTANRRETRAVTTKSGP